MSAPHPAQRRRARRFLVQALYQWQLAGTEPSLLEAQFLAEEEMAAADVAYFRELLRGILAERERLEPLAERFSSRPLASLDPVTRAVLWIGLYELAERLEVPYKVVLNEAVDLARTFGPDEAHRFVNGVLDRVAGLCRAVEVAAERRAR
ncbi:MAG: N utilization substance protein B [Porticoccaceae bacterium]|nr:MAG: N utilization substance protein B [Porticoccaceae bacterium]